MALDKMERTNWKECVESKKQEEKMTEKFKESFKPFDSAMQ